jgi:hypothetical protein
LDKFFKNDPSASMNPNNELAVVVAIEEGGPHIRDVDCYSNTSIAY